MFLLSKFFFDKEKIFFLVESSNNLSEIIVFSSLSGLEDENILMLGLQIEELMFCHLSSLFLHQKWETE